MITGDLDAAIAFLNSWEPDGPWLLTAIEPDTARIDTEKFDDPEKMRSWLDRWQGRRNLYFSVNRPRPGVTGRAKKTDIEALLALHTDIDPPKEPGRDLAAERSKMLAKLQAFEPAPSCIVFSGGGYQAFWLLDEPITVDDEHPVERLEAYSLALGDQLGADHCFNIDRIMRLPGTINLPDQRKKILGQTVAAAELVSLDLDRRYRLDQFAAPIGADPGPKKKSTDRSRSAKAFRQAQLLRARYPDIGFDRFCELLREKADPAITSWLADKGDDRQLQRLFDRSGDNHDITIKTAQFQGRSFTREADGRWFDEHRAELDPETLTVTEPPEEPWVTHPMARWATQPITEPEWFIEDLIPHGQLVGLYGLPGARKSTLLLQWMIGAPLGKAFRTPMTRGPTYGLFCEDGEMEIARRARSMLRHYNAHFENLADCHAESLVQARLTTFVRFSRTGVMQTTPAWDKFIRDIERIRPVLVVLDVVADFFGGNEITRNQSGEFAGLLDRTASRYGFALIFSAHPSLRGIADKTLTSGSTAWEGKVRARLTLTQPVEPSEEDPTERRVLTLVKANYAKTPQEIRLVIDHGAFTLEDLHQPTQKLKARSAMTDAAAERTLLDRAREALNAGTTLSNYRQNPAYIATVLADQKFPFTQAEPAFKRLVAKKIIRFDGSKRVPAERWIITEPDTRKD